MRPVKSRILSMANQLAALQGLKINHILKINFWKTNNLLVKFTDFSYLSSLAIASIKMYLFVANIKNDDFVVQ